MFFCIWVWLRTPVFRWDLLMLTFDWSIICVLAFHWSITAFVGPISLLDSGFQMGPLNAGLWLVESYQGPIWKPESGFRPLGRNMPYCCPDPNTIKIKGSSTRLFFWAVLLAQAPIHGTVCLSVQCSSVTKFCEKWKNEILETSPTLPKGVFGESLITPCWDL